MVTKNSLFRFVVTILKSLHFKLFYDIMSNLINLLTEENEWKTTCFKMIYNRLYIIRDSLEDK